MKPSTKSKRSTGLDTVTVKDNLRHFLNVPDTRHLFDFYWGGPERRISSLTVKIIGVNAIALIILAVGILYLGRYQDNLIRAKLETFQSDIQLVAAAIHDLDGESAGEIVRSIANTRSFKDPKTGRKRLVVFDENGRVLVDSQSITDPALWQGDQKKELESIKILQAMIGYFLEFLPEKKPLPVYPTIEDASSATAFPDVPDALEGRVSLSVWLQEKEKERIFLSAAAPVLVNGDIKGAVLMTRDGRDIEREFTQIWIDILRIFFGTLLFTILLSIYISGTIGQPLLKLAKAAEAVRRGKADASDIPDFSDRMDEIGELSVVIKGMTKALSDRLGSIEAFAADVAHELKNPLTSLKSAVETAGRIQKKSDQKKMLEIINHDIERMDRLITDISAASRLDTELSREAFTRVDLRTLLNALVDAYRGPLERKLEPAPDSEGPVRTAELENHTIRLSFHGSGPFQCYGIESRLWQGFENILSNALSFSPEGSHIEIRVSRKNKVLRVEIADQGPGIPESRLKNIFERFYSERPDHEAYGRHSGLGLSICKQIAQVHGGRIYAENIVKSGQVQGAKFVVELNAV